MNKRINIIEVVYKDPHGVEAGGVENYALNIKNVLGSRDFNIIFAYTCTNNLNKNFNKKHLHKSSADTFF
jgi:hypothetical protein